MRRLLALAALLAPTLLAPTSCSYLPAIGDGIQGAIFRHTIAPLDVNLDRTPAFTSPVEEGVGAVKHVSVRQFPVYVDIMWDSNAIGDIANDLGLEAVYYADREVFSILGIWNKTTVHIYGRPSEAARKSADPGDAAGASPSIPPQH